VDWRDEITEWEAALMARQRTPGACAGCHATPAVKGRGIGRDGDMSMRRIGLSNNKGVEVETEAEACGAKGEPRALTGGVQASGFQ
jgi:hypothetical protein